jgi:uncharacterized membrane protein YfcA
MTLNDSIKNYFCCMVSSDLRQIVTAFVTGLLLGPFNTNLLFKIIFIIVYEIILYYYTRHVKWKHLTRLAITCAGLYGFFLGKWLINNKTGLEKFYGYE